MRIAQHTGRRCVPSIGGAGRACRCGGVAIGGAARARRGGIITGGGAVRARRGGERAVGVGVGAAGRGVRIAIIGGASAGRVGARTDERRGGPGREHGGAGGDDAHGNKAAKQAAGQRAGREQSRAGGRKGIAKRDSAGPASRKAFQTLICHRLCPQPVVRSHNFKTKLIPSQFIDARAPGARLRLPMASCDPFFRFSVAERPRVSLVMACTLAPHPEVLEGSS